jgi:Bacterial extracellular solute-binding proteins, family 5 Middle
VRKKVAGVLLVVSLVATACGSGDGGKSASSSDAPPKMGGQLTVADPLAPSSLDPIAGSSGGDQMSLYPIFDRLVNFDPKTLEPQPGLARSWQYPDPKTLVLTLRDGVKFQDGTPFDAEAVKASLDRARAKGVSVVASDLSMIDSIEATGPLEVTVHLNRPDASLGARPKPPPRGATAGSTPATRSGTTSGAGSTSWTGSRTPSDAGERTCRRPRSRGRSSTTRMSSAARPSVSPRNSGKRTSRYTWSNVQDPT